MIHIGVDYIVIWSVAVGVISITIAKGRPFKEVREFLLAHHRFTGQMVACPYCLSHYVATAAAIYLMISLGLSIGETLLLWAVLIAGAGLVGTLLVLYLWISKKHSLLVAESRTMSEKSAAAGAITREQAQKMKSAEIRLTMALTRANLEALGIWPLIPILLKSDIINNRDLETMDDIPVLRAAFMRAGLPAFDQYSHSGNYGETGMGSHVPQIGWNCDTVPMLLKDLVVQK